MRAISNQTRKTALCATPCASVSANRTRTSVSKRKSTRGLYDRALEQRGTRGTDSTAPAVRRADRGRCEYRERDSGLPLADRALGAGRPDGVRLDRRLPPRPGQGLELLQAPRRDADRGRAEPGPRRARRPRAYGLRRPGVVANRRERGGDPPRGCGGFALSRRALEWALLEEAPALSAHGPLDLVRNSEPLAHDVRAHAGVRVRTLAKGEELRHRPLSQPSFAIGKYDVQKGEKVVTNLGRLLPAKLGEVRHPRLLLVSVPAVCLLAACGAAARTQQ